MGLIGMWKAFAEMEDLGLVRPGTPKMIAVQSSGCPPIVKAWDEGKLAADSWPDPATLAAGLRSPSRWRLSILAILKKSQGTAVAVTDDEIMQALGHWARVEGIFAAPEGAASLAAYRKLRRSGFLSAEDSVVLFNTGSGLKYLDLIENYGKRTKLPAPRQIGGIIGPY